MAANLGKITTPSLYSYLKADSVTVRAAHTLLVYFNHKTASKKLYIDFHLLGGVFKELIL